MFFVCYTRPNFYRIFCTELMLLSIVSSLFLDSGPKWIVQVMKMDGLEKDRLLSTLDLNQFLYIYTEKYLFSALAGSQHASEWPKVKHSGWQKSVKVSGLLSESPFPESFSTTIIFEYSESDIVPRKTSWREFRIDSASPNEPSIIEPFRPLLCRPGWCVPFSLS